MTPPWQQLVKNERGQALPVVLILLVLGALLIVPALSYASTSINAEQVIENKVRGTYAADAGVEQAMWCIKNSVAPPGQLTEELNQMQVAVEVEDRGPHTLVYEGVLVGIDGNHYDWLSVTGEMVWEQSAAAYKYTITVTWQADPGTPGIKLTQIGVRLPLGYAYETGSAASFGGNLSTGEPDDDVDSAGAHMLSWELPSPRPEVSQENPVATQTFYVAGEGDQQGDYSWVVAGRNDIGTIGEVTGELYRITAQAMDVETGEITATVTAVVLWEEGAEKMHIILWQIGR